MSAEQQDEQVRFPVEMEAEGEHEGLTWVRLRDANGQVFYGYDWGKV